LCDKDLSLASRLCKSEDLNNVVPVIHVLKSLEHGIMDDLYSTLPHLPAWLTNAH